MLNNFCQLRYKIKLVKYISEPTAFNVHLLNRTWISDTHISMITLGTRTSTLLHRSYALGAVKCPTDCSSTDQEICQKEQ